MQNVIKDAHHDRGHEIVPNTSLENYAVMTITTLRYVNLPLNFTAVMSSEYGNMSKCIISRPQQQQHIQTDRDTVLL